MFLDNTYHYMEMEQCARPGSIGDSMAETGRYITLAYVIGDDPKINLINFITPEGLLRHPDSPWRENDTSGDQVFPFIAAANLSQPLAAGIAIKQIQQRGYRTGNGDFITVGMLGQIRRAQNKKLLFLSDIPLVIQAGIFKLPFRWSDSTHWFERSKGSSADYLNFINAILFAKAKGNVTLPMKLALKMVGKQKIMEKIEDYYRPEPNSQWILDMYKKALELL